MTFPELKPLLRGWLHLGMVPAALAAGIVLITLSDNTSARIAAVVYVTSALLLFTVSAIYHRGTWGPRMAAFLRRFDHANIYLLIAGSYTPFVVVAMKGDLRAALLTGVWSAAVLGVIFRTTWLHAPRWLFTLFYLLMGWVSAFFLPQLLHGAGVAAFVLVAVGGGLYTVGGLVYATQRPNPSPRYFGYHEVFHALTIAAFITQFVAVSLVSI